MKYYGIENMDAHYMQILPELPVWTPDDEGRLIYVEENFSIYFGSNVGWESVSSLSISGYSGYSGINGISGISQGPSGYSGISGLLGISGYSGYDAPSNMFSYFDENGYMGLPNGIIINWGYVPGALSVGSFYDITYSYESKLLNGLLYAEAIPISSNYQKYAGVHLQLMVTHVGANGKSGLRFKALCAKKDGVNINNTIGFFWYSIGV